MKNIIKDFKNKTNILLADGATGTNFFASGLQPGDPPELWNLQKPSDVINLHKEFISAGANIILTNSFGANSCRLKFHNIEKMSSEINISAAQLSKKAITSMQKCDEVMIGGSIGPTGEIFKSNGGNFTYEEAVDVFYQQAVSLKKGGVDFLWIETLSSLEEIDAAQSAADKAGIGTVVTMSFDTAKRTMMGVTPKQFIHFFKNRTIKPLAVGANCGVGPSELLLSMKEIKDNLDNKSLLVAKGNCGIPQYQSGKISYSGTKSIMIKYAILCDLLGVDIIGGCCGTTPEHIKAIKNSFVKKNEYFKKYNFYKNHLLDEDYFRELTIKEIGRPWKNISDVEKPLNNQFRKRRRGSKFKNNL